MSVFKRTYRRYPGPITNTASRFLAVARYGAADLWSSRITVVLFVLCFVPSIISLFIIYIMNNEAVRMLFSAGHGSATPPIAMDERFFYGLIQIQCWPALVLTAWIGPKILSGDLSNDALPIILSHPISRVQYIGAKLAVLLGFLTAITVVPITLLFVFQSYISAVPWASSHIQILIGSIVGCVLWITLLAFLALALASWVKWRIVATGMVFAAIFVPAGMGTVFNVVMRTNWGNVINIPLTMSTLWRRLVGAPVAEFLARSELSTATLLVSLAAITALCIMALNARIRAREVVRG